MTEAIRHTTHDSRLVGCMDGWMNGLMVGGLAGWLVGWLTSWLAGWFAGWLASWLAGGLVDLFVWYNFYIMCAQFVCALCVCCV